MFKLITFDLDNTLIDFIKMKRYASDSAAKAMIKAGLDMELKKAKDELFDIYLTDIEGHHAFQDFLAEHNDKLNKPYERVLAAAINAYNVTRYKHFKPYPGVRSMLKAVRNKGMNIAIVTDAPKVKAYQRLDAMGIVDMFDIVIAFEDTRRHKPSVMPFRKVLKHFGVLPSETLHVGDWPEKDILGAKKLGIRTCFARYGYVGKGKIVWADYKIEKPRDIILLLNNPKKFRVNRKFYK